jgi:hypothetical protein
VSENVNDRPDEDKRATLRTALPLVIVTVFGRTVWAKGLQQQGSACGSACPSNGAQIFRAP